MKISTLGALSTEILAGTALSQEKTSAGTSARILSGPVRIALNINGRVHHTQVEPRVTLLDTLRNRLDLTGTKKVCDRGTCGACTVHLDGRPVYACTVLAVEAQRKEITTIEGLSRNGSPTPLQAAFVENDAQQCGFCTPGFMMACTALLAAQPHPAGEDLRLGLGGNLCRCGTYAGIGRAIKDLSRPAAEGRQEKGDGHG
ncbi:MAG: (2Fe-2S)-binding protein [Acidobacteriota bacterium]